MNRMLLSVTPMLCVSLLAIVAPLHAAGQTGSGGGDAQDLAKKLANPISDMVSVPLQFNWVNGNGPPGPCSHSRPLPISPSDRAARSSDTWTIPINVQVSKVTRMGPFPASIAGGLGVFVVKPDGGPEWQLRTTFTMILPRKI
jgi:hypothetical protein